MQPDGNTSDSRGSVLNDNVFQGCGKLAELNGTKYPFVISAECDPTCRV